MSFNQRGFTLAGALALIAVMTILLAMAVPLWSRVKLRDNEEELIFRGKEYVEAITRYQQRFGAYPPDLETLQKLKFIRRLYSDPMTKSGKWKVIHPDSLVQTGEAGKINQPGQKNSDEDDDDENKTQTQGTKPFDFGADDKDESLKEDDSDEEPEVESTGPVVGVASRSKKASIKVYNGQSTYNKWAFTFSVPPELQKVNPVPKPGTKSGAKPGKNSKPGSFQSNPLPNQNPGMQGNPLPDPNDNGEIDDDDDEEDEER